MDLSTGRRVGYDIDSLIGSTASNVSADGNRKPITRDRDNCATFAPGHHHYHYFVITFYRRLQN